MLHPQFLKTITSVVPPSQKFIRGFAYNRKFSKIERSLKQLMRKGKENCKKISTTTGQFRKITEKVMKITGKGEVSNFGSWQGKCNIVLPHISQHPDKLFPLHKLSAFQTRLLRQIFCNYFHCKYCQLFRRDYYVNFV